MKTLYTTKLALILFFIISAIPTFSQIKFAKHSIGSPAIPSDVYSSDINGDGAVDILTVSRDNGGNVVWWKNNGSQVFSQKLIASNFAGPRSVRAGDIDSDGDNDIIAAALEGNKITWWENDGAEGFLAHELVTGWAGPHTVELCDLDQDGDMDILCSQFDMSASMSEIAWWENDGNQVWTKHVVSSRFQQSPFVYGADMDNDGDIDLIGTGELNGEICLWTNDGQENWTEQVIDNQFSKAHTVLARDFDKDGDLDILAHASTSSLQAWYENIGSGNFNKKPMENLGGAIYMDCEDFDLDGDYDLIATGMTATSLVCYENDGFQRLTRNDLPGGLNSGFALNVTDLDNDGDKDVIAVGYNSNTLAWWENTTERTSFLNGSKWLDYNDDEGLMFVSNEEDGSLVRIESSGYQFCLRNNLPVCTGLIYRGGDLWVAAGITIHKLDPLSGIPLLSLRTPTQYLQGLTMDGDGNLYASDPYSGIIIKINTQSQQIENLVTGLSYPGSIRYDGQMDRILVLDGENTITIKAIDPATGQVSTTIETSILAGGDIVSDGIGNHYISSPQENSVYAITRNLQDSPYLYSEGHSAPTGLVYFSDDETLGLLSPVLNTLEIIPANATGVEVIESGLEIQVYPNPVVEVLYVKLPFFQKDVSCRMSDVRGNLIRSLNYANVSQMEIPVGDLPRGIYFIDIQNEGVSFWRKFIKR